MKRQAVKDVNKKMRMTKIQISIIFVCILIILLISGCDTKIFPNYTPEEYSNTQEVSKESPEEALPKEVSSGRLVEVYEEYVKLNEGERKENWIIIKNVKESQEFRIIPCSGCVFEHEAADIPSGEYRMIRFYVEAEDGQKQIRVKDARNNAYGYAKINVIVEGS